MKKQFLKRCTAWVLTVMMIINIMPVNVFATTVSTEEHVHTEECIGLYDEISDVVEETEEILSQEQQEETSEIQGTEESVVSENIKKVQQMIDNFMVKYNLTVGMSDEQIEAAVYAAPSDPRPDYEAIIAEAENLTEEELTVLMESYSDKEMVFSKYYDTVEQMNTPELIDGTHTHISGISIKVTNTGSTSWGQKGSVSETEATNKLTVTAKPNTGFISVASAADIVITNTSDKKVIVQFDWTETNAESLSITANPYKISLEANTSSEAIVLKSNKSKSAVLTMSNITVTEAKTGASVLFEYSNGTVESNGTTVANGDTLTLPTDSATKLVVTPAGGYTFYGWTDDSGVVLSTAKEFEFKPIENCTIKAVFGKDGDKGIYGVATASSVSTGGLFSSYTYYDVSETYQYMFDDLGAALACAGTTSNKYVVLLNNAVLPAEDYTIPKGVNLLIPFNADSTFYAAQPGDSNNSDAEDAKPIEISAYRTLTMSTGTNIIVNGAISVSATHEVANGGSINGCIVKGDYGHIRMEKGSTITVNSGANLYAWGFITGDGAVTAKNGSKIYELFQVTDYNGGGITSEMKDNVVFPFNQYYVQNIEVPLTIEAGAQDIGHVSLYMAGARRTSFSFISGDTGDAMFKINKGAVTKRYDGTTDRLFIELHEDSELYVNGVSLSVAGVSLNTKTFNLPITSNITMKVAARSVINIKQSVEFLPGAELYIEKDAICQLGEANTANWDVFVYDSDEWGNFCSTQSKKLIVLNNVPTRRYNRTEADLKDAKVVVDGTLKIFGNVYTTKGGANVCSTGTGVVELMTGVAEKEYTKQASKAGNTLKYVDIPVTQAQLRNADGSVVTIKENYISKYTYNKEKGVWDFECVTHTKPSDEIKDCQSYNCAVCGNKVPATSPHTSDSTIYSCVPYKCTTCEETVPATAKHTTDITPACTATVCTRCNNTVTFEHTKEVDAYQAPTCIATGLTEGSHCSACKEVLVAQEIIPVVNHTVVVDAYKAPTCTATGLTEGKHCSVCNTVLVAQQEIPVSDHTEVIDAYKAPTCTATGLTEGKHCSVCNTVLIAQEEISAKGHTEVTVAAVPATCTETGRTEGLACTVCETYLTKPQETPSLGHQEEIIAAVPPTCTGTGLTEGKHCTRIGCTDPIIIAQEEVASVGHNYVDGKVMTEPTCYSEGLRETVCDVCGDTQDKVMEKTNHTPGEAVKDEDSELVPGCETEGSYEEVVSCTVCTTPLSRTTVTVPAIGHTRGTVTERNKVEPSCTVPGRYTKVTSCTVCFKQDAFVEEGVVIPELGHDEENHDAQVPTCTDIGWDAYVTCKRCDYTTYVEKEANGHTWNAGTVTANPTCVTKGNTHYECTVAECDGAKDEAIAIDSSAHTEDEAVEENRNEATCTEDGSYDMVVYCKDCDAEISRANHVIDKTGHKFDVDGDEIEKEPEDGDITTAPTCTDAGEIEFACQNGCGTTETEILEAADHLAGEPQVVTVESTCTVKGTKTTTVYCERVNNGEVCGHQMSQTVEDLELALHTPAEAVEEDREEATCTEDGHYDSVVYCSVCETYEISRDTIILPATGHKYDLDGDGIAKEPEDGIVITAPTCEEKGVRTFECVIDNCDGYETEDIAETGHDWEYVTSIKPTCTEPGKASSSLCITCGKYVKDTEGEGTVVPALGHSYTFVDVEAPSCTAEGSITSKCTRCQDIVITTIDKLEHNEVEIPAVEPTCTEDGSTAGVKCSVCSTILVEPQIDSARRHIEETIPAVAPSCTAEGSTEGKKCSVCGEITQPTETIEATGHNGNIVVDRKESTCTESGYEAYNKCSECGEIVKETEGIWKVSEIKILTVKKHNTEETTDNYVATSCTAAGSYDYVIKCTECNEDIYRKTIGIPMLDHTEGAPVTENVIDVTCTTDGKYDTVVYCTACTGELSRATTIVTHEGHKEEIVTGTAVTCTVNGKTDGKKCSVCDEILLPQETIYAQGHTVVVDAYKAPTCTETGLKAGRHCGVCNEVLLAQEVIPSKGHTEKTVAGIVATCTTTGLTEGIVCSVCGDVIKTQETIPALKHEIEILEGKAPTCTETGLTEGQNCTREGCKTPVVKAQEIIPALGHTEKIIIAVSPTCTETGLAEGKECSVCFKVLVEQEIVPELGHKEKIVAAVEPTCTETGLAEGKECSVCFKVLVEQEIVPELGHEEKTVAAVAPKCTTTGLTEGIICTREGCEAPVVKVQETVPELGHTKETLVAVEPTCTKTGLTEGEYCSACFDVLVEQYEIPMKEHEWGMGIITVDPICEVPGERIFTCSVCRGTKSEEEPAFEHKLETIPAKKPTYTEDGWNEYVRCIRDIETCQYNTKEVIPKLGDATITSFDEFIENLEILEMMAAEYKRNYYSDFSAEELVIKYIRTGVDRYNSGSWKIMAGEEDASFAEFVKNYETAYNEDVEKYEDMMKVTGLKNITEFTLPNGNNADIGHVFGTMDISITNKSSCNHADVAGWAGDTVDLLTAADNCHIDGTDKTVEQLVEEIRDKIFLKDSGYLMETYNPTLNDEGTIEGSFSQTDIDGDLDAFYIFNELMSREYKIGTLTELFSGYMTESLKNEDRAAYFLKNRLDGVTLRSDVREAVYNEYVGNTVVNTLEKTRNFENSTANINNMRKASCYVVADYICKLAGDWVAEQTNSYVNVYNSSTAELAPGITQKMYNATTYDGKRLDYYIAIADVTRDDVSVHANYKDNDPYISFGKVYSEVDWGMKRVIDQAKAAQVRHSNPATENYVPNYNVIAAFNGTGFNMTTGEPSGLLVMEGIEVHGVGKDANGNPKVFNGDFFGIQKDGSAIIGSGKQYNELIAKGELTEAISSFAYRLVKDGEICVSAETNDFDNRAPRTAIGITKTGKVVMLAIDGRQDDNGGGSVGASPIEIAQIMLDAGCWQAFNLDGGGSTTYVAKQPGTEELAVINSPSDGVSRSVASSLFIVSKAPSSTEFDHAVIESDYNYLTKDSTAILTARAVSATGNALEMPEGTVWTVDNEAIGIISEDGVFTAKEYGEVNVELKLGAQVIGSKTLYVVNPNNIFFTRNNMNAVYGKPTTLPIKVVYDGKDVSVNANDIIATLSNEKAGVVDGFDFIGNENSGLRKVVATVALKSNMEITSSINISMFSEEESSFDFENATGGDTQLAFDREVSNSTYAGNGVYKIEDVEKDMVTSYTFAIDMSKIEMPEKVNDLTYMLPGSDLEDASAWKFLLQLAERVSGLTNVQATLKFDSNMKVDYSNITVTNEYFKFKESIFDESTNTLTLKMNWIDQGKAIDEATANPICILSGIKLTPKEDANWSKESKLNVVNLGNISYEIYLGANALYSFACNPENQDMYGLYPYENPADTTHPKGGYLKDTYKDFKDNYTLINALPEGWVMEAGGWSYYVDGNRLTGINYIEEDAMYYDFDEKGINVGQTPYTGEHTNSEGHEFYIIKGQVYKKGHPSFGEDGWIRFGESDWRYFDPTTGFTEKVTVVGGSSTCVSKAVYKYTSESGKEKVYEKDIPGHEYALQPDGKYVCKVCYHERIEMSEVDASLASYVFTYTGKPITTGTKAVAYNGYVLKTPGANVEYADYFAVYEKNTEVGTAFVLFQPTRPAYSSDRVTWRGNAGGTVTLSFEIRPDLPTDVKAVTKDNTPTLEWTAAKAEDVTYVIYKSLDGQNYSEYGITAETYFVIDNADKSAYFKIGTIKVGLDENGNEKVYESINKTNAVSVSSTSIRPDIILSGIIESGKPRISWSVPDANVKSYRIEYSEDSNFRTYTIGSTTSAYYTHYSATEDETYYYRMKIIYADGSESMYSNIISATATISKPVVKVKDEKTPVIAWEKVDRATQYIVYRADSINGVYEVIGTTISATYKDTTTEVGKSYYYKVAAVSAKGNEGPMSGVVAVHKDPVIDADVIRVAGETRYSTALATAEATKESMGVDKFSNIIIASGENFADALAGSYLAKVKKAPIIMTNGSNSADIKAYIDQNMESAGTIYILGSTATISQSVEDALAGYNVKRLSGATRYDTNIAILKEAGVKNQEILVCSGAIFADSLSASAVGKPILLVDNSKGDLTDAQKEFLSAQNISKYYIIGGTPTISEELMSKISEYGNVERVSGETRYETSVAIANRFFYKPDTAVIAYAENFPDGLSGGPLAMSMNAPLILTKEGNSRVAEIYVGTNNITKGYILGGANVVDDATIEDIFNTNTVEVYQK